jgi:hypothetical protein
MRSFTKTVAKRDSLPKAHRPSPLGTVPIFRPTKNGTVPFCVNLGDCPNFSSDENGTVPFLCKLRFGASGVRSIIRSGFPVGQTFLPVHGRHACLPHPSVYRPGPFKTANLLLYQRGLAPSTPQYVSTRRWGISAKWAGFRVTRLRPAAIAVAAINTSRSPAAALVLSTRGLMTVLHLLLDGLDGLVAQRRFLDLSAKCLAIERRLDDPQDGLAE